MRFGLQISNSGADWKSIRQVALAADSQRWTSLWLPDHLLPPAYRGPEDGPCLESWTLLSALAEATQRVRLGCLVTANLFRHPSLVAKMAATLDDISGGRFVLGIGAGWYQREHEAYGLPFPGVKERQDRLEEAAALLKQVLTSTGPVDFEGTWYRLERAPFAPRRTVPLMIGGSGEKRTLRTVALYGDMMNLHGTVSDVRRKLDVLRRHCEAVGRNPADITCTLGTQLFLTDDESEAARKREQWGDDLSPEERHSSLLVGSAQHILEVVSAYEKVGVQEIIVQALPADMLERVDRDLL